MITVVSGAPCSGKTTYVRENAGAGDIVIDFDTLAVALGSAVSHDHTPVHVDLARLARRAAIDEVLLHPDFLGDVWIVDTAPGHAALVRYAAAGARFEVCDPGRNECLARALRDGRPSWTLAEIHRWYDTHTQESA
ncbi:hypothetical protein [Rhodococcus pyridinivorans]|uniref:Phage prohead protease n=1 Tax=Rhodococcus pyridinivorans AK37 TaxID=1114960 RepID=H0JXG5_9NOCA|nr:hypothetical protein [Rhodococcus pyridinivorans]EHK80860.1 phage prohead protease [Rhodococcus pyridinivorans AK37]MCD2142342.1 hypothetical protein [Rhodococcus pyridinivorans]